MLIKNWKVAMNRFMIDFEDRLVDYIPPGSDKVYIWVKAEC